MAYINKYCANFAFWGERRYVHGSHMLCGLRDAAVEWDIAPILKVSAYFRSRLGKQGIYYLYKNKKEALDDGKEFNSMFHVVTRSGTFSVGLASEDSRDVVEFLPDNENELVGGYSIDENEKRATVENCHEPSVNVIIALNKKLLTGLIPMKSWLMARLDLDLEECSRNKGGNIAVELVSNMANVATRSVVVMDGKKVGDIYFNKKAT